MENNNRETCFVAVAGGANIDIGGQSERPLITRDSNPGVVRTSVGGVGRNIAHNLALMGTQVQFFTIIGDDAYGDRIEKSCLEAGMTFRARRMPGERTPVYLYIADADGDMSCAVSDMALCNRLTPDFFARQMSVINTAKVLVIDANLPEESIAYLAREAKVPVFADPVSVNKAGKLKSALPHLFALKPNRMEAELLSGVHIGSKEEAGRAARALRRMGVRNVFLSLGPKGVLAANEEEEIILPALPCEAASLTGAGDAFTAGLVHAYVQGEDFIDGVRLALSAASIAIQSEETINPQMSEEALRLAMTRYAAVMNETVQLRDKA